MFNTKAKQDLYFPSPATFLPLNIKDKQGFLPSPVSFLRRSTPNSRLRKWLHNYMNSLDSPLSLGVYTTTAVALIIQKLFLISLHRPLPTVRLILLSPLLFGFDFISLLFLHRGMASIIFTVRIFSFLIAISITLCSATFVSYYYVAHAEINWGRALEVLIPLIQLIVADHSVEVLRPTSVAWEQLFLQGTCLLCSHWSCNGRIENTYRPSENRREGIRET
jgi:hypothetical protein